MIKRSREQNSYLPARRRLSPTESTDHAPPPVLRRNEVNTHNRTRRITRHQRRRLRNVRPPSFLFSRGILVGALSAVLCLTLLHGLLNGLLNQQSFSISALSARLQQYFGGSFEGNIAVAASIDSLPDLPELDAPTSFRAIRKIRKGDTLPAVLARYGLSKDEISRLVKAFDEFQQHQSTGPLIKVGREFQFLLASSGDLIEVSSEFTPGKILKFRRLSSGQFIGAIEAIAHTPRERIAVGLIETSFAAAAAKAGVAYDIIDELVDLFSDRIEFAKDFHKGDRFSVIYRDLILADGRSAGSAQIVAAALEVDGQHIVAARYIGGDGKARYFDEKGQLIGNAFLRYPLKFSRISSTFTSARFHPVLKRNRPHNGVDFAAPTGTPVRSVADGHILFSGYKGGNGNTVKIRHNARYATAYLHLNSISSGLKNGSRIRRGDVIGTVGMTGLATGPHLHFAFYDNGRYVDPLKIKLPTMDLLDPNSRISPDYLKMVLYTLKHYQTVELERSLELSQTVETQKAPTVAKSGEQKSELKDGELKDSVQLSSLPSEKSASASRLLAPPLKLVGKQASIAPEQAEKMGNETNSSKELEPTKGRVKARKTAKKVKTLPKKTGYRTISPKRSAKSR